MTVVSEMEAAALLYREAVCRELRLRRKAAEARDLADRIESEWQSSQNTVRLSRQTLLDAVQRGS